MPKKIGGATREDLVNAPLPQQTKTYTVISHSYAINTILQALEDNGFTVKEEEYRCNEGAKVANGSFVVDYQLDPELTMVYSFSNSYDKSLRFKSTVGAKVILTDSYMLCDTDRWIRKHTGTADNETEKSIIDHITNAKTYFAQLVKDKETMKGITISLSEFGTIIGELFLREILTSDQISFIGKEYKAPSFKYPTTKLNLWTCYNHVINALKMSHPSKWMHNQMAVHLYFSSRYNLDTFDEEETTTDPETESIIIDGEEVPAMTSILNQIPPVILPGFENVVQESSQEQSKPLQEYVNPNQITIDQVIAETNELKSEATAFEKFIKDHCELCEKTYTPTDETCIACIESDPQPTNNVEESVKQPIITKPSELSVEESSLPEPNSVSSEEDPELEIIEQPTPIKEESVVTPDNNEIYIPTTVCQGIEIGDVFEFEEMFVLGLRIESVEGIDYLVCTPVNLEESTQAVEETPLVDLGEESITEERFSEDVPEPNEPEEPAPWEKEEPVVLPSSEVHTKTTVSETKSVVEPVESIPVNDITPQQESEEAQVAAVINKELTEIYGYSPKFTYKKTDQQYNIELESGEVISLPIIYIDGILKK